MSYSRFIKCFSTISGSKESNKVSITNTMIGTHHNGVCYYNYFEVIINKETTTRLNYKGNNVKQIVTL